MLARRNRRAATPPLQPAPPTRRKSGHGSTASKHGWPVRTVWAGGWASLARALSLPVSPDHVHMTSFKVRGPRCAGQKSLPDCSEADAGLALPSSPAVSLLLHQLAMLEAQVPNAAHHCKPCCKRANAPAHARARTCSVSSAGAVPALAIARRLTPVLGRVGGQMRVLVEAASPGPLETLGAVPVRPVGGGPACSHGGEARDAGICGPPHPVRPAKSLALQSWNGDAGAGQSVPFSPQERGGQGGHRKPEAAELRVDTATSPSSHSVTSQSGAWSLVERCSSALRKLEEWGRRVGGGSTGKMPELADMQLVVVEMCAVIEDVVTERDEAVRVALVFEQEVLHLQAQMETVRGDQVLVLRGEVPWCPEGCWVGFGVSRAWIHLVLRSELVPTWSVKGALCECARA